MCALGTGVQTWALPIFGHQPFPHHDRGHAFGDCDKPLDRLARLEQREDIARIHSLLDLIFAGLDRLVRAEEARVIAKAGGRDDAGRFERSEEHTSELQSLMRISYAVFCLKKKKKTTTTI